MPDNFERNFIPTSTNSFVTTAKDIMSKKVVSIDSDVSPVEIAKIMDKNNVGSVVITKDGKPHGIITERDMLSKISAKNKRPSEVMTSDIISSPLVIVSSLAPAEEVAEKMILNKIRRVVVSDVEQILGIISVTDFVKHLHSMLSSAEDYDKDLYQGMIEDWEYWSS